MFNVRDQVIRLHHSLGKQVNKKTQDFDREKIYGQRLVETFAEDIGKSGVFVWTSLQFYKYAPDIEEYLAKKGKDISWNQIVTKELPKPPKKVTPPDQQEGERSEKEVPPQIGVVWNEKLGLWDIKINKEDFPVIALLNLRNEIDAFFAEQTSKER